MPIDLFKHRPWLWKGSIYVRNDLTMSKVIWFSIILWFAANFLLLLDKISIDWEIVISLLTVLLGILVSIFNKMLHNSESIAALTQQGKDTAIAIRGIRDDVKALGDRIASRRR